MKDKMIKISDLCNCRRDNSNMDIQDCFAFALKNSDEYIKNRKHKAIVNKISITIGVASLILLATIIAPPIKTFADTLQLERVLRSSPNLFVKVKGVSNMYANYTAHSNMPDNLNLFMDMMCTCLDSHEKELFVKAVRGLDIQELLNIIFNS